VLSLKGIGAISEGFNLFVDFFSLEAVALIFLI